MDKLYILVFLIFAINIAHTQTVISTIYNGSQIFDISAPEYVRLLPGFGYKPEGTASHFKAYIDPIAPVVLPAGYTNYIDPDTRTLNYSLPVGTTPGQAAVSLTGGATYTIPIFSSPGTAGMQPSVSLVYNSQSGNGIAGYGWSISVIGAVTRVPHTIYHDGDVKGVDFNDDRFALNGQRLVNLNTSTYGADDAEYYTEIFDGSKVISHVSGDMGPDWFEVFTKQGQIIEYGNTVDSRFTGDYEGSEGTLSWYINKITDANGNYMTFSYLNSGKECVISEIKYTGNNTLTPVLEPYNSIKFYYSDRTDKFSGYLAGKKIESNVLLDHIDINSQNEIVKSYKLKYYFDTQSNLNEIEEIGNYGTKFNSTVFGYGNEDVQSINKEQNWISDQTEVFYSGDFNGDGISDIFKLILANNFGNGDKKWEVWLNDGNGNFTSGSGWNGNLTDTHDFSAVVGDFNGDGYSDVYLTEESDGVYELKGLFSTGMRMVENIENYYIGPSATNIKISAADYNGDGLDELFLFRDFGNLIRAEIISIKTINLMNGQCSYDILFDNNNIAAPSTKLKEYYTRDFTADGIPELALLRDSDPYSFEILKLTTNKTSQFQIIYNAGIPCSWWKTYTGDFNGDGLTDILCWTTVYWEIYLYDGTHFVASGYVIPASLNGVDPTISTTNFQISDYNQDGKDDIAYTVMAYGGKKLVANTYFLKGNTFEPEQVIINENYSSFTGYVQAKTGYSRISDFNGDGINDFGFVTKGVNNNNQVSTWFHYNYFHPWSQINKVVKLVDGLNNKTKFNYTTLTKSNYIKGTNAPADFRDIQYPISIVSRLEIEDGLNGFNSTDYVYKEAIIHLKGKGFLGFKSIVTIGPTGIISTNSSSVDPTYCFLKPDYSKSEYPLGILLNESSTVYTYPAIYQAPSSKVYFPLPGTVTSKDYFTGIKTVNETTVDQYCNSTSQKSSVYPSFSSTTPTAYTLTQSSNFQQKNGWCPSKPSDIENISFRNGQSTINTKKHFIYSNIGNIDQEEVNYQQDSSIIITYNNYVAGLPSEKNSHIKNSSATRDRRVKFEYDPTKRFVAKITDPLDYVEKYVYDGVYGNLLSKTDANNQLTSYSYDGFGRLVSNTDPQGVGVGTSFNWYQSADKPNVIYYSETTSNNGPASRKYYDKAGRIIYVASQNPDGQMVCTQSLYNAKGQLISVSEPYFENSTASQFTTTQYDNYNHPATVLLPTGVTLTYSHPSPQSPGFTTSVHNSATQVTTYKTIDATGKVISASDPGGTIAYEYSGDGQPTSITAPDGSKIVMQYDEYGHQVSLSDPDAGTITYSYNAWGELTRQTDASGRYFDMTYDKLSRLTKKTSSDNSFNITNTYYTQAPAIGLLSETKLDNGYKINYQYDDKCRIVTKTEHYDKDFSYFYTYDSRGNLDEYTFPTGYVVKYSYNSVGSLVSLCEKASGKTIYAPGSYNARGQLIGYANAGGNLYTAPCYDEFGLPSGIKTGTNPGSANLQYLTTHFNQQTGNLEYRKDTLLSLNEDFKYEDALKNRLSSWQVTGQSEYGLTYANNNGNVLTKSDFTSAGNPYVYDALNKPHAVQSVAAPLLLPAGARQETDYNILNKVSEIRNTNQGLKYTIDYGFDEQRVKSRYYANNVLQKTKYYVGGDYEEEISQSGAVRKLHYLPGGGLYVINQAGAGTMYYVLTDYQGTWTKVVTETGATVESYSFDPWGRRRNATNWTYNNVPTTFQFDRGYIGHEMLDAFGLINMNGRVYDPVVARFLSPDNYVQMPDNSQGLNRYSYCLNNPLVYTDPSGELPVLAVIAYLAIQGIIAGDMAKDSPMGFARGFALGAATAAISMGVGPAIGTVVQGTDFLAGAANAGIHAAIGGTITYGLNSLATGQPFDWKGWGLNVGMAMMIGGVEAEYNRQRDIRLCSIGCQELGITMNDPVPPTDKFIHDSRKIWYPQAEIDKCDIFTVENVPNDKFIGKYSKAGGITEPIYKKINGNSIATGRSLVYFNKDVSFTNARTLYINMGHELHHVSQIAFLGSLGNITKSLIETPSFHDMMESHAYNFRSIIGYNSYQANNLYYLETFEKYYWDLYDFSWEKNLINPF